MEFGFGLPTRGSMATPHNLATLAHKGEEGGVVGRGRIVPLLVHEDLQRAAEIGWPACQSHVEHDADTVPVGRWRYRLTGCLFRRHVRGCAKDIPLGTLMHACRS